MKENLDQIIREFELVKTMELHAHDLYAGLLPEARDPDDKAKIEIIIKDESRHAELVQKIIDIIKE